MRISSDTADLLFLLNFSRFSEVNVSSLFYLLETVSRDLIF